MDEPTRDAGAMRRREALGRYEIVDTPEEADFDDLVKLAADACAAPVCLISFVEEARQWFKARVGFGPRETPIGSSICAHAIAQPDLFVIEDTTKDRRTAVNPLVTGPPHVRFYAGMPLVTPDGVALGTLCLLDVKPRGLTPAQAFVLQTLARQVMIQLELRRLLREQRQLARAEQEHASRLALAMRAGRLGAWEMEIATGTMTATDSCREVFGIPPGSSFSYPELLTMIHPDDRARVDAAVAASLATGADYDMEYRIVRPDGSPGWVLIRAQIILDAHGRPERLSGVSLDITGRKAAESRQAALIELGDRVRDLGDRAAIMAVASAITGRAFGVARAGFAAVDDARETVLIAGDWCAPGVASIAGRHRFGDFGSHIESLKAGEIVAIEDVAADPRTCADTPRWETHGIRALLNVPIMERGRVASVVFLAAAAPRAWLADEIAQVRNIADRVRAEVARAEAEEQRQMVNLELSHRMKNMLAMVQAIANQTMRSAPDVETAKAVLSGRLVALGRAHDALMMQGGSGLGLLPLADIIDGALRPHQDGEGRITASGPPVHVGARAALSLSLILHELATNAIKYGALASESGRVAIEWGIATDGDDVVMSLNWTEAGGPPVEPPQRRGFGSRLIERGLATSARGKVKLSYNQSGVQCRIISTVRDLQMQDSSSMQL